jgi:cholest-4-en-3-one 26-monooxygenase
LAEGLQGLEAVDLTDASLFLDERHHEVLTELRRRDPVHWHPDRGSRGGFWCITRHADVVTVNRDADTFVSGRGVTIADGPDTPDDEGRASALLPLLDAPVHTRQRRIVSRGFTARTIALLEDQLTWRARTIVDAVVDKGRCDFVTDIASELPLQAIAGLMGIPPEDHHRIVRWGDQLIGVEDPEFEGDVDAQLSTLAEMTAYAAELRAQRLVEPRDDLITHLTSAQVDGASLSESEFGELFLLLAIAGHETTRNAAAQGIRALAERPEQLAALTADPSPERLARAVEEILRWACPVMHFRRTATRDVEIGGRQIRQGDRVVMWYVSANRDEAVFEDPFRFDIDRHPNDHLSFGGGGPHYCLGAPLGRLELRVLLHEIVTRLPDLRLDGPPELLRSNFVAGVKHLPIRFGRPSADL